jgi:hypothetical protein
MKYDEFSGVVGSKVLLDEKVERICVEEKKRTEKNKQVEGLLYLCVFEQTRGDQNNEHSVMNC